MRNWWGRKALFSKHLQGQNLRFFNPIYDLTLQFKPYRKPALVPYIIMFELLLKTLASFKNTEHTNFKIKVQKLELIYSSSFSH